MTPIFWFDKDGVLAKYDYALYESEAGAPAPWLVRNAHVYRNLEEYENMAAAFRILYSRYSNKSMEHCPLKPRVLTSVSDGLTLTEHVLDGMKWCEDHLHLKARDFYACAVEKESIPVMLKREITKCDVLLDDYNNNLRSWQAAGGTSIKVVNGINSESKEFPCISVGWQSEAICDRLLKIADSVTEGKMLGKGFLL